MHGTKTGPPSTVGKHMSATARDILLPSGIPPVLFAGHKAQQHNTAPQPSSMHSQQQALTAANACCHPAVLGSALSADKQVLLPAVPLSVRNMGLQQPDSSTVPARPAAVLASGAIKHRASRPSSPPLLSCSTASSGCSICHLQVDLSVDHASPPALAQHACCKDCGYIAKDSSTDSFLLPSYRPLPGGLQHTQPAVGASASTGMQLSSAPSAPSTFLDQLSARSRSLGLPLDPFRQLPVAVGSPLQRSGSSAATDHEAAPDGMSAPAPVNRAAPALRLIPVRSGSAGQLMSAENSQQQAQEQQPGLCSQLSAEASQQQQLQQQQADLSSTGRSSPATADESLQTDSLASADQQAAAHHGISFFQSLLSEGQQGEHCTGKVSCNDMHSSQWQQAEVSQEDNPEAGAQDSLTSKWQLPQSICDQLQQAKLTVTRQLSCQAQLTVRPITDAEASAAGQSTANIASAALQLEPCSTSVVTAEHLQPRHPGSLGTIVRAADRPMECAETLSQLRAVVTDNHYSTRPRSPAQTDWRLYPALSSQPLSEAGVPQMPAVLTAPQILAVPPRALTTPVASAADAHAVTEALSALHDPFISTTGTASRCDGSVLDSTEQAGNSKQRQCVEDCSRSSVVLQGESSCYSSVQRIPQKAVTTSDQATETDAAWSIRRHAQTQVAGSSFLTVSLSPDERRILARRYGMAHEDAAWPLTESASSGSDSEGSVISESNLRPSSVGRCRVNSGRHSKVGTRPLGPCLH